jgi:hypothetical protein
VHEVDTPPVDRGRELLHGVQPAFGGTPVEAVAPVGHELAQVGGVGAERPARAVERRGNARVLQARLQVREHRVGHLDAERADRRVIDGAPWRGRGWCLRRGRRDCECETGADRDEAAGKACAEHAAQPTTNASRPAASEHAAEG